MSAPTAPPLEFVTRVRADAPALRWLLSSVFVGSARLTSGAVELDFFRVA